MKQEINDAARAQIRGYFRQLTMLFSVFLASIFLFLISVMIAVYYQGPMDEAYGTYLLFGGPFSGLALLLMGSRLFRARLATAKEGEKLFEKMDGYRAALVVRMLLLDGAAFIQLVAFVMTGNKLFIALALVIATLFLFYRPTLEKFISEVELSEVEAKVMRDHGA
ncbi:MAG TPA: hypothetical protein ENJ82_16935 [Bacteroidetes bacterium]|nr:hypothetical protein [Bacteroidota bacterium]